MSRDHFAASAIRGEVFPANPLEASLQITPTDETLGGRIGGIDPQESGEIPDFLFRHQDRGGFLHAQHWTEGDRLIWDDIGAMHNAVADYLPDESRCMWRVPVMATLDDAALGA